MTGTLTCTAEGIEGTGSGAEAFCLVGVDFSSTRKADCKPTSEASWL